MIISHYVQVNICHDIALAVAYLHSNDIIHRVLSSNNVLIMAKSRAKVTDFGMSKLDGAAPSMPPLTMSWGTLAYVPPEALNDPPVYTKKLDCFSEGVIMMKYVANCGLNLDLTLELSHSLHHQLVWLCNLSNKCTINNAHDPDEALWSKLTICDILTAMATR